MSNSANQSITDLIPEVVADDDEIRQRLHKLVVTCIEEMEQMVRVGSPTQKMAAIRSLMPQIARVLERKEEESNEIMELREEFKKMRRELRA